MPQFEVGTFPSQIFWLVVSFTALYLLLARTVLPKISEILAARQRKIDDDLERASDLEQQAKEVLAEYEATMEEAKAEAQALIKQAVDEMNAEAEKEHQALADKLSKDLQAAEARIAEARNEALGRIQEVASEAARAATQRLIGVEVERSEAEAAVADTAKARR